MLLFSAFISLLKIVLLSRTTGLACDAINASCDTKKQPVNTTHHAYYRFYL